MSLAGQDLVYGETTASRPASSLRTETRYDIIAQGFGMQGVLVDATSSELKGKQGEDRWEECANGISKAVESIVQSGGPGLIDLRVSPRPHQDTTKAMGKCNAKSIWETNADIALCSGCDKRS